ncbi:YugN family protein [Tuberibacillus sp. Marseille-P3662]|uniref:YugN family protein n=1 Tax=Tuberibacillus sp. Marseille-P3662 TaxID=1965358 RepID=UPI000A1CE4CE|nr:YugN family protein [Tuberibacillus sp. Marseille-P3662]
MKVIESELNGQVLPLIELENILKPMGYAIGGNWDYDHGSFDYKIDDEGSYVFLRLPFEAVEGELDRDGCVVRLGEPFLLHHKYRTDNEQTDVDIGSLSASVNQFQTPLEKDAEMSDEFVDIGKDYVQKVEQAVLH